MSFRKLVVKRAMSVSLFLFLALVALYSLIHSSLFSVKEVAVTGNQVVMAGEIKALSGIIADTNIFQIDPARAEQAVRVHPLIKDVKVIRHLPNRIEINVVERKPWAVVPAGETFWIIDDCGVCIDRVESIQTLTCPVITIEGIPAKISVGRRLNPDAIGAVRDIIKNLSELQLGQISEFHCKKDNQVYIYTLRGTEIRFGHTDRLSEKVGMIDRVLEMEQELSPGEALAYVDLRFKGQPVAKYR